MEAHFGVGEGEPELGADKKPRVGLVVGGGSRDRHGGKHHARHESMPTPSTLVMSLVTRRDFNHHEAKGSAYRLPTNWLSRFGWVLHTSGKTKARTICNFQMQATGAHMMQLGVCLAVEAGLQICAIVHDAILIEAPLDRLEADAEKLAECMRVASREVLDGFEVGVDIDPVKHPDRYIDDRDVDEETGERIWWARMMRLLEKAERRGQDL